MSSPDATSLMPNAADSAADTAHNFHHHEGRSLLTEAVLPEHAYSLSPLSAERTHLPQLVRSCR
jgi:hypothetical protein